MEMLQCGLCCRYVDYICRMVSDEPTLPHCHPVMLSSLTMSPVPLVNRVRCVSAANLIVHYISLMQFVAFVTKLFAER